MNANIAYQAAGLTGWVDDKVSDVSSTVVGICLVAGIIVGILIIVRNPTVGRTIVGVVVGAFIASLPVIIPAAGDLIQGDINAAGPSSSVVEQPTNIAMDGIDETAGVYELTL